MTRADSGRGRFGAYSIAEDKIISECTFSGHIGATYLIAAWRVGSRYDPQQCNNEVRGTHEIDPRAYVTRAATRAIRNPGAVTLPSDLT